MQTGRLILLAIVLATPLAAADPPTPSSAHPRLFMSSAEIAGYAQHAQDTHSSAAALIARCQDTIDTPRDYTMRGGSDGDNWPGAAVACAFAYRVTQRPEFLTQALLYWHAALDDDQMIGDHHGCIDGVSTAWQTWAMTGNGTTPPVLLTVTHDTGYAIRWYGPDVALTYDWLNGVANVPAALLAQTRVCLTNWIDWYAAYGYHHDEAGANYNAGFVITNALGAIAIGNDGGADGHLWTHVIDTVFGTLLVGDGLAGASTGVGTPAGAMLGGDWLEGWQYGPLSVLEYAVAARALEQYGAPLPAMDAWTNSLVVRYIHGNVPHADGQWVGGDFESTTQVYQDPAQNIVDAVLAGPSSDQAAAWALSMKQQQHLTGGGYVYNAIAELRDVTAQDYHTQTPAPPLWYLARGSRAMYVRTAWDANAFWGVFSSPPQAVSDHQHFAASNFVFTRGGDHLIVDSSQYGAPDTMETNAVSAASPGVAGDYAGTQTPWSTADLPWARASDTNVYAARSDFAGAFAFSSNPSDIHYARREWVFLPEGEIVTIDRVHTADAAHVMYVNFHANTNGMLHLAGNVAAGPVGGSAVAIHAVNLSGGTPSIQQPGGINDSNNCTGNYPNGSCTNARLAVDIYALRVPGPFASAIHVIDGLATGEAQAIVGSINDAAYDPMNQNGGVIGAAVFRSNKQSYVVATSAHDGATGAMMTYAVPGTSAARHIVFDAPEASDGTSHVATTMQSGACVITITAGSGSGFAGHPLMFGVDTAANACAAMNSTNVAPAMPPTGGGIDGGVVGQDGGGVRDGGSQGGGDASADGADGGTTTAHSGCGCEVPGTRGGGAATRWAWVALLMCAGALRRGRREGRYYRERDLDDRE